MTSQPTHDQIRQADRNHRRPAVTRGSRLYAALAHVRRSRNSKPAGAGLHISPVAGQPTTGVRCDCTE